MITLGKKGDIMAYQRARAFILNTAVTRKVFTDFAPRYRTRPGGYTRIHKFGNRPGDNAPHAIIELVDNPRDLKFEMTARAVGWDLLAKKVRHSSIEEVAAEGVKGVSWAVKEARRQGPEDRGMLRPLTRWNLQKTLRYRAPADRVELEKKANDHIVREVVTVYNTYILTGPQEYLAGKGGERQRQGADNFEPGGATILPQLEELALAVRRGHAWLR